MKTLIIACVLGLLAGCASLNNAGTAKYSVEPIVTDNGPICCRVVVENGKEYAVLKAHVERRADGSYGYNAALRDVTPEKADAMAADYMLVKPEFARDVLPVN